MTSLKKILLFSVYGIFISSIIFCKQKPEALPEKTVVQDTLISEPAHHADRDVHWGYDAEHGPAVWATLSPTYALC
jgi:carbonic anhydrase